MRTTVFLSGVVISSILAVTPLWAGYANDWENESIGATPAGWSDASFTVQYDGGTHNDTGNKVLCYYPPNPTTEFVIYQTESYGDFSYMARFQAFDGPEQLWGQYAGMIFRAGDASGWPVNCEQNHYRVWFADGLYFRKRVGGVNTLLAQDSFTYVKNSVVWLRVDADDGNFKVFTSADGVAWTMRLDITDDAFSGGYCGLVGVNHIHYDQITVAATEAADPGQGVVYLAADVSGPAGVRDCYVDRYDLAAMAGDWLADDVEPQGASSDIAGPGGNPDGQVNVYDFCALAKDWLRCTDPEEPENCVVCSEVNQEGCNEFTIRNNEITLGFSNYGLALQSIEHGGVDYLQGWTPIFRVQSGGATVSSNTFEVVEKTVGPGRLDLTARCASPAWEVRMEVELVGCEHRWRFGFVNDTGAEVTVEINAPDFANVRIGPAWDNDVVMIPYRFGLIKTAPLLTTGQPVLWGGNPPYIGSQTIQLLDISDKDLEEGMCLIMKDSTFQDKYFNVAPDNSAQAVKLFVTYRDIPLGAGESFITPWNVFSFHRDGWEEACDLYRQWFYATAGPIPARPQWLTEAIGRVRIQGAVDDEWLERITEIVAAMPYYQNTLVRINFLWANFDLSSRKEQVVRQAVQEMTALGVKTEAYIEGYCLGMNTTLGQQHGAEWAVRNADNSIKESYPGIYAMCSAATGWQDWLANETVDMVRGLGFNGIYLDSLGVQPTQLCYNLSHGHSRVRDWNAGTYQLIEKVSQRYKSLDPNALIGIEGYGGDFLARYAELVFTGFASEFSAGTLYNDDGSGLFQNYERLTNIHKYLFPEMIATWQLGNGEGDFAQTLLTNEMCHVNALQPYGNIKTATIEHLIAKRLANLDTLNYGSLDKYLHVGSQNKLMYNGFRGHERYLITLLNPHSSSSSYTVELPLAALPEGMDADRLTISDLWGSSIDWSKTADTLTISGSIGAYPWSLLRALMGTGDFYLWSEGNEGLYVTYPEVESLPRLDNLRLIRIAEAP